jgi:pyruvate/2-oxoglutarate dehydrogenase complex dihydrolipoamide dehydrogenase (E3) component
MRDAENFGAQIPTGVSVDFSAVMERVRRVRARISRRISAQSLSLIGVDVYFGEARFAEPEAILVDGKRLRFKRALVASGARPKVPAIAGLAKVGYLTNESVFDLNECPPRLLVLGGGPLGCELAQAFSRLGSQVTILQKDPMFLGNEERDAAQILSDALARDGIGIHLNTDAVNVRTEGNQKLVDLVSDDGRLTVTVDEILVGIGSALNVEGMNLEAAGVQYDQDAGIPTNDYLQTTNPLIIASALSLLWPQNNALCTTSCAAAASMCGNFLPEHMVHLHGSGNCARWFVHQRGPREGHPGQDFYRDDA